jgi:hypothetical protein
MTKLEACELAVDLIRQLAAARGERDIYRLMVNTALTQLHEKTRELERERAARYRLLDEYRALRERRRKETAA